MADYKEVRFLESTSKLREILSRNSGRELSLERANQISVCLEQGRLFFEAAEDASWEIKPLLVYYGMVGFAKAIYLGRSFAKLESLPPRHGVTDVSNNASIEELRVRVDTDGTFHALNDTCSKLEKLIFHDKKRAKLRIDKATCESALLQGKEIGFKDILSRVPGLKELYRKTFGEDAKIASCSRFSADDRHDGVIEFGVHDALPFDDLASLEASVRELKKRFPFLEEWRLSYAAPGMGIKFANLVSEGEPEFSPVSFDSKSCTFSLRIQTTIHGQGTAVYAPAPAFTPDQLRNYCQPVRGNLMSHMIESTCLIESWNGLFLSELSLYYLGMFLLSSLVRYRPNVWANAIARRSFPEKPADDHALVLVEDFVDRGMTVFSSASIVAINAPFPG